MKLKLVSWEENEKFIVEARQFILDEIHLGPPEYIPAPLKYAFYIFAYADDNAVEPVALSEGFLMDQAYNGIHESPYHRGTNLLKYGNSLSDFFHIRSTYIVENFKKSGLSFIKLVAGMVKVAGELKAEYITTATTPESTRILDYYPRLGLNPIGQFQIGSFSPLLYIGRVQSPVVQGLCKKVFGKVEVDPDLLLNIRSRRAAHL